MFNLNVLHCKNYKEFYDILQGLNKSLKNENVEKGTFSKISEFIENNKDLFHGNPGVVIILDSIGVKVSQLDAKNPLISNLQIHIRQLLPSDPEHVKVSLQFFRSTISDETKRIQSIADWISLMKIPLASLDLSVEELAGLLTQLEYVDLTNYHFEKHNLINLTNLLLDERFEFKTKDSSVLGTIAGVCAKENARDTAKFIKKFGISDPLILEEIAYLCAKNNGEGTADHIKNFEIKDPGIRAEIALLCAKECGGGTAYSIKNFEIDDPVILAKIARICAQQDGGYTAQFIKNFEIVDPTIRIELARVCAKQNGSLTAQHIKNFEIVDPTIRIEIALVCAIQNGSATARYIEKFEIADATIRTEIARICATQNGIATAQYIKKFKISNTEELDVFYKCILSNPETLFLKGVFSLPDEFTKLLSVIQILKSEKPEESLREELFNEINQLISKLSLPANCLQILIETSKEVQAQPARVQNVIGLWLVASLVAMKSLKNDSIKWMIKEGIWRELALLHDPELRVHLSNGLFELSVDEEKRKAWGAFCSSVRGKEGKRGLMLLAIPFFSLEKQGIVEVRLNEIATSLTKCQKDKTSSFRSVYHIKNMLYTMQTLVSNSTYSSEIKKAGFEKIFHSGKEETVIKNIIATKGLIQLKETNWPESSEDLSVLFRNTLEKMIPLEDCKVDVSQKYDEIFGSCPDPGGLLTYAAGLKTLQEPELMTCLGKYVSSVLEGTFKEMRYKTEGNPHLAKIMESNPTLLNTWKEDLSFDFEALTSSESTAAVFNPEDWLKETLITQQHLGDTELTFIKRYLDDDSNKEGVFQELIEQINLARKEKENTQLRKDIKDHPDEKTKLKKALKTLNEKVSVDPNLARLNLEKACLNLIQKGQGAEKLILVHLLEEIDKALKQKAISSTPIPGSEFAKDVHDLIEDFKEKLKSKERSKDGLKVLFTDNPIDLLLCGIGESCQRLDQPPSLNKALLGYLIDGKNRIVLIKEGNKIIARCMLRLLWDGEQPVIYQEVFYPRKLPIDHQVALNNLAKKVAKKLNVPLTSKIGDLPYGKDLEALGGPAPYDYNDGGDHPGVQKNGRYKILGANKVVLEGSAGNA